MPPIVVQKYGGSSVATPEKLRAVAARVVATAQGGALPVVVVSAMGRTTDALVALASEVSTQSHRREMDMILTAGERISMALLAMAIEDQGRQAVSFTGSQAGIITTTDHNQAHIIEVRPHRVEQALAEGKIVIVGGFAGVSTAKEITTLGRGGSDTTAIALAGALGAASCDILSDVDGVYSADPAVVKDARRLDRLGAGEVLELGLRGARVLAPEAIDYALRHGIEIRASEARGKGPGTVITTQPRPGLGRAIAVTHSTAVLPLRLEGGDDPIAECLCKIAELGLHWLDLSVQRDPGPSAAEAVIDLRNSVDVEDKIERLCAALKARGGRVSPLWGSGTASLIGEGIAEQPRLWSLAQSALLNAGFKPRRMWATRCGLHAELPSESLEDVVRMWHQQLCPAHEALGKPS